MATFRLRYENGRFVPLDPLPGLQDGDEVEASWPTMPGQEELDSMLDRTRGLWADWEDIEDLTAHGEPVPPVPEQAGQTRCVR